MENMIAGTTSICSIGEDESGLTYRGYSIEDLAREATFEEVAYLLIHGHLPDLGTLEAYQNTLFKNQNLPEQIKSILEKLPSTSAPMDILRTAVSLLGLFEEEGNQHPAEEIGDRLMPFCISALLYWHHYIKKSGLSNIIPQTGLAGQFLTLLHGKEPDADQRRALDVSFILYAEHEFNASTFAARVCASTRSDFYSCIVAAIGTLRGNLHGGANEAAMELISRFSSQLEAEKGVKRLLADKQLVMGFGHRVYKMEDPRTPIIKSYAERLSIRSNDPSLFEIASTIERVMLQEKKLFPNLDFYSALVYHYLGIPVNFFTPLFVIARISGWSAHIIEQRSNNRLIRPLAQYVGPKPKEYISLTDRRPVL